MEDERPWPEIIRDIGIKSFPKYLYGISSRLFWILKKLKYIIKNDSSGNFTHFSHILYSHKEINDFLCHWRNPPGLIEGESITSKTIAS